jgi:hypothetical protein
MSHLLQQLRERELERERAKVEKAEAPATLSLTIPCTYILANKMQCMKLSTAGTCQRHTLLAGLFGTTIPTAEVAYEILGANQ